MSKDRTDVLLCVTCAHRRGDGKCEFTLVEADQKNFCDAYDEAPPDYGAPGRDAALEDMERGEERPRLEIIGKDGNAFAILGAAMKAARRAGWPKERIDDVMAEAKADDYDHLLGVISEHFDVC